MSAPTKLPVNSLINIESIPEQLQFIDQALSTILVLATHHSFVGIRPMQVVRKPNGRFELMDY